MPKWISEPPEIDQTYAHRIVRTPSDRPLVAIVTSDYPMGCRTHFANNRTVPCEGDHDCEACGRGLSFRWHGYVGALLVTTLEHVIFEYTAPVAKTFANYIDNHFNLRGCKFEATRPGKRPNSRVVIQCKPADLNHWRLPEQPKLALLLCHIWGVAYDGHEPVYCTKPQHKELFVNIGSDDARYPTVDQYGQRKKA